MYIFFLLRSEIVSERLKTVLPYNVRPQVSKHTVTIQRMKGDIISPIRIKGVFSWGMELNKISYLSGIKTYV